MAVLPLEDAARQTGPVHMGGSVVRTGNPRMSGVDRIVSTDTGHAPRSGGHYSSETRPFGVLSSPRFYLWRLGRERQAATVVRPPNRDAAVGSCTHKELPRCRARHRSRNI